MNILHLDSSPALGESASRQLSLEIVDLLRISHPYAKLVYRDLTTSELPHLSGALYQRIRSHGALNEPSGRPDFDIADEILREFLHADIVVIGAPMYNLTVPTQLKAWIDRIVIAGRTFVFTENGPAGLCTQKRAYIASSRGSAYIGTPYESLLDHQESYLRAIFTFIGMPTPNIIRAEGLDNRHVDRHQTLASAKQSARELVHESVAKAAQ